MCFGSRANNLTIAFFAPFNFFETAIEDFALATQASPRETGRDGSPSPAFSFVMHSRVQQWMANLPIFQAQSLLEQRGVSRLSIVAPKTLIV